MPILSEKHLAEEFYSF